MCDYSLKKKDSLCRLPKALQPALLPATTLTILAEDQ